MTREENDEGMEGIERSDVGTLERARASGGKATYGMSRWVAPRQAQRSEGGWTIVAVGTELRCITSGSASQSVMVE